MNDAETAAWWGRHNLDLDGTGRWQIGALTLWVERREREWRLAHRSSDASHDATVTVEIPAPEPLPTQDVTAIRLSLRRTDGEILLAPLLPDRPVVSQPETPFCVLAGEEVRLYISSPVWVDLRSDERRLVELPIYRASDTWFGPNTREGELCFASRTSCRTELEEVPLRPQRAVSAVTVQNRTAERVLIERLKLPAPYLDLFGTPEGALWTQPITLEVAREGGTAEIRIERGMPEEAEGAVRLAARREDPDKNLLVRALGAFIG